MSVLEWAAARLITHFHRFSTVWFARGLPADGHIITLELSTKCAKVPIYSLASLTKYRRISCRSRKKI